MLIETKVIWIWIHLMGVILWAGGFFYVLVGLLPALQSGRTTEERVDIMRKTGILFRRISWLAIIILAVSGLFSLGARIMKDLQPGLFLSIQKPILYCQLVMRVL